MSYEEELRGLRDALDGATVGHPTQEQELAELARLIDRYPEHARRYLRTIRQT